MKKKLFIIITLLILCLFAVGCKDKEAGEYGINLINGGDFEDDLFEYWNKDVWVKIDGFTKINIVEDNDGHVLYIENTELNDAKMKQTVNVEEKQIYKLSGYIKAENCQDGMGANLSFENMFYYTEPQYDTDGEYVFVELYGKTAKGQEALTVFARIGGYSNESSGVAYFDDIRLEKVEEAPDGVFVHNLEEAKPQQQTSLDEEDKVKFAGWMTIISILFIFAFIMVKQSLDYGDALIKDDDQQLYAVMFGIIIVIGLLIRAILAITVDGYPNDIGCWMGWSSVCADKGIAGLYDGSIFIDYPPGYMYILYIIGWLNKIPIFASAAATVKIPPILADAALAIIIFKMAKNKLSNKAAILLASLYYLSPAIITDSAAWGQIDSFLALMGVLFIVFLLRKDWSFLISGVILGAGVLVKPQMLFFAPIFILGSMHRIQDKDTKDAWKKIILTVLSGIFAFTVLTAPLIFNYGAKFVIDMFLNIVGSYGSASLNACNIWALLGGMWEQVETPFLGMTYGFWGYVGLGVSVVIFAVAAFRDKNHKNIFFHAALLITGIFILSGKMHERYMYPAMALLLVSYIYTKDRRHLGLFGLFTVTQFANTSLVLANKYIFGFALGSFFDTMIVSGNIQTWISEYGMMLWTSVISIAAVAGYVYMVYVGLTNVNEDKQKEIDEHIKEDIAASKQDRKDRISESIISSEYSGLFKSLGKKDYIFMLIITLVYSVIAFVNLGNNYGPETMWDATSKEQHVIVDFGSEVEIEKVMFFRAQGSNGAHFTIDFANENIEDEYETAYYYRIDESNRLENLRESIIAEFDMKDDVPQIMFSNFPAIFKWYSMENHNVARYAKITVHRPMIRLVEMVFIDAQGNTIPIENIILAGEGAQDAVLMFDEQDTVPEKQTYMNSTYFDEIYHAGTAWEHIMLEDPYETTHPPLGKVIMSLGIRMFGMNPFGWRFMGTIVGILMIPVMYLFAMVIFKKTRYAAIATVLLTFDFMHFTQTRIATIDSYGVFFIMLMFLCMAIYYRMSFNKSPLIKTLIPLALSGVFFGLGAASKWICLYAGAGLAVVFFYTMFRRYKEYAFVNKFKEEECPVDKQRAQNIKKNFAKYTIITLAFCIVFFILIPVIIYTASYIPILKAEEGRGLEYVIKAQEYMFNYHKGITAEHSFASPWYEWPLIIKPMWYYSDSTLYNTGRMTSIAAFGNPAVWWIGAQAFIWLLVDMFKRRKSDNIKVFVLLGLLAQYLPWILVPRSMFIYHYFASIPFMILIIVMMIRAFENRERKHIPQEQDYAPENKFLKFMHGVISKIKNIKNLTTYVYLLIVVALFVMFYPVIAGMEISSEYGQVLKWMPTWWFLY